MQVFLGYFFPCSHESFATSACEITTVPAGFGSLGRKLFLAKCFRGRLGGDWCSRWLVGLGWELFSCWRGAGKVERWLVESWPLVLDGGSNWAGRDLREWQNGVAKIVTEKWLHGTGRWDLWFPSWRSSNTLVKVHFRRERKFFWRIF